MRILCVIPALPEEVTLKTLQSIWAQSIPIALTVIATRKVSANLPFPAKMSVILNDCLKDIKLESFDYILRVDADTILQPDFLEKNLEKEPDAVGFGQAHLIRVQPFQKLMHGRFQQDSDDSYLNYKFQTSGYNWQPWNPKPLLMRSPGKTHGIRYFLERGRLYYMFGFEPLHVLGHVRWEGKDVFAIPAYFYHLFKRSKQFDVKTWVWRYQIQKLTGDIFRRQRF